MEDWRTVTVQGYEQTYINLTNVCGVAWDSNNNTTYVTFVDGTKLYVSEKPQDIFDQRFRR